MSALQPKEFWEESGRWEQADPEMFKLKDRHSREFCLGPTHEEYITSLIKGELSSYKSLPLNLYQIQTKFRDERRPRYGLIRSREFLMKDAYSFDETQQGLETAYKNMWHAYDEIFTRLALNYKVVRGDSGNMGGSYSHEFHAITEHGESTIASCENCSFAETDEVAECVYDLSICDLPQTSNITKVHTPNVRTIDELISFFGVTGDRFIKTLLYKSEGTGKVYAVMIPGDRSLNLVKLARITEEHEDYLVMLDDSEIWQLAGSIKGFIGPYGLKEELIMIADSRVIRIKNGIAGSNEKNYHIEGVNLKEGDFAFVEDIL